MWSPDLFDKCMAASFPSSDGADNLIKSGGVVLLLWGQSIKAGQLTLINYIYISIIDEENTLQLSGNQKLWSLSINSHVHYWFISRPISHPGKPGKSLLTNIANMADAFQQIWQPPSSKYGSCLPANMADAFQQIWLMLSSKYGWCLPANMADAFQQIWDMPSTKYGWCLPANMGYAFQQSWRAWLIISCFALPLTSPPFSYWRKPPLQFFGFIINFFFPIHCKCNFFTLRGFFKVTQVRSKTLALLHHSHPQLPTTSKKEKTLETEY